MATLRSNSLDLKVSDDDTIASGSWFQDWIVRGKKLLEYVFVLHDNCSIFCVFPRVCLLVYVISGGTAILVSLCSAL